MPVSSVAFTSAPFAIRNSAVSVQLPAAASESAGDPSTVAVTLAPLPSSALTIGVWQPRAA